jgi:conjugal transfer/entry exclusion protein
MLFGVLVLTMIAVPAHSQLVVIDPGNLEQTSLIAERTLRAYQNLVAQYETLLRMAQALGNMDRYRVSSVSISRHDPSRWTYGAPWLQGLNSGDLRGELYRQTTRPLASPGGIIERLPTTARKALEHAYATVEITDAVAEIAGNQVAQVRGYSGGLQSAIQALETDVVNPSSRYHELTSELDKIAAGALLARRQDTATNQLLSHVLEQLLARGKRARDTEAATMNMRLANLRDGRLVGASLIAGAASDLRTWRQP